MLTMEVEKDRIVLRVENLRMYFPVRRGLLQKKVAEIKAVDGVTFSIAEGEIFGLVGESGCGKTTVARCIMGLYKPTAGKIIFEGRDVAHLPPQEWRHVRRKIALIFQDPYSSLDPRQRAIDIVGEPLKVHRLVNTKRKYVERVEYLFRLVGLDPSMMYRFPHEFSGGQRQRIGIARALASEPTLIICDEPLSSLDVSIQAQIINLLKDLQEMQPHRAYLFISHDLAVIRHMCDRVAVMYLGRIVEMAQVDDLFSNPMHPYTQALISSIPVPDPWVEKKRHRITLKGEVPSPISPPPGCAFHPRCPKSISECSLVSPELKEVRTDHYVACFLYY